MKSQFEIIVIGGSHAGLSAALVLGRSMREVLIVDGKKPRNRFSSESHGFYTRDGESPLALIDNSIDQLKKYKTISFMEGLATSISKENENFQVRVGEQKITASRIILATGVKDILPEIKGIKDLWGTHVFHCPYCHGWEVKNSKIALILNNKKDFDFIKLVFHWTSDLTLYPQRLFLSEDNLSFIKEKKINVIEEEIREIKKDKADCNILTEKSTEKFKGIFIKPSISFNNELAIMAGCSIGEYGEVITDEYQQTTIKGIYSAGDLTYSHFQQIAVAAATGLKAAISVNASLL